MSATNLYSISPLTLTGLFSKHLPPGMPWLHNPFFISKDNIAGSGPRVRVTVGEGAPKEEQVFYAGITYNSTSEIKILGSKGDIHINSAPSDDDDFRHLAFICTASFVLNPSDISASINAVWKPFWLITF